MFIQRGAFGRDTQQARPINFRGRPRFSPQLDPRRDDPPGGVRGVLFQSEGGQEGYLRQGHQSKSQGVPSGLVRRRSREMLYQVSAHATLFGLQFGFKLTTFCLLFYFN